MMLTSCLKTIDLASKSFLVSMPRVRYLMIELHSRSCHCSLLIFSLIRSISAIFSCTFSIKAGHSLSLQALTLLGAFIFISPILGWMSFHKLLLHA